MGEYYSQPVLDTLREATMTFKRSALLATVVLALAAASNAGAATFTGSPKVNVTGSSTSDTFDLFTSTVKCTNNSWSGFFPQESPAMTVSMSYSKCTAFGLPATVTSAKDAYTFTSDGTMHINSPVSVHVYSSAAHSTMICHVTIPAQTAAGKFTYTNNADGTILISGNSGNLTATQIRTNMVLCPPGTHTTSGSYTSPAEGGIVLEGEFGTTIDIE